MNAELKSEFIETTKASETWSELENTVCVEKQPEQVAVVTSPSSTTDSKDINESEIVDEISDEDDDDYDEDEDEDSESEVITKDSLIAEELEVIKGLNERIMDRKFLSSKNRIQLFSTTLSFPLINPLLPLFSFQSKMTSFKDTVSTSVHTAISPRS